MTDDIHKDRPADKRKRPPRGTGLATGLALGVALGIAMDDLALWLAIGLALGVSADAALAGDTKDGSK